MLRTQTKHEVTGNKGSEVMEMHTMAHFNAAQFLMFEKIFEFLIKANF
jgi:hypothetical protein